MKFNNFNYTIMALFTTLTFKASYRSTPHVEFTIYVSNVSTVHDTT